MIGGRSGAPNRIPIALASETAAIDWMEGGCVAADDPRRRSAHHDLIRQQGVTVGQVEHGLLRQLLGVVGA
jgi:hypothetical protein